jgi:hypothetical protein
MKNYIDQLLVDLENAKNNEPPVYNVKLFHPDEPALQYGLEGVAQYLNSPYHKLEEILGIDSAWYPPFELLSEEEVKAILEKTLELWTKFNFEADLPENLPLSTKYKIIVDKLKEETQYVSEGTIHFEFCDYDVENCIFGLEYCSCKEFL